MNIFKASEILKVAIQIENNGLSFYNQIKEKSKNFPIAEVFGFLAKEEERHAKTFERLLEQAGGFQPAESYPGEYALYLEALAGDNIFKKETDLRKIASEVASDANAVDLAIGLEKDSIIFYNEMKKFVPPEDLLTIDKIIAEEKEHLLKLFGLKRAGKS